MRPVAAETNIESLKQYTLLLEKRALALAAENAALKNLSVEDAQSYLTADLRDQYTRLQKKFFGSGRESLREDRPIGHVEEKLKLHGEYSAEELKTAAEKSFLASIDATYRAGEDILARERASRGIRLGAEGGGDPGFLPRIKRDHRD